MSQPVNEYLYEPELLPSRLYSILGRVAYSFPRHLSFFEDFDEQVTAGRYFGSFSIPVLSCVDHELKDCHIAKRWPWISEAAARLVVMGFIIHHTPP